MNKKNFENHIKTFLFTILSIFIAVFILLGVIRYQVYLENVQAQKESNVVDKSLVGILIDKNQYLLQKDPSNYKINLKLADLYEEEKDYANSEFQYKEALGKIPYGEFETQCRMALFYIRRDRLEDAENIISSVDEKPDKELVRCKGEVYNALGDKYYAKGEYDDAGQEYKKSLFYYSKINSDQIKTVKDNIASAYVYLADEEVRNMQIQDAIDDLQTALSIVDAPIIKYKLALLLMQDSPDLSCKYFEEVFQKEPSIINYDTYYKFLSELAAEADANGSLAKAELYRYRIKKLKDYYASNLLSVEDISVEAESGKIKLNGWTRKYDIKFEFRLKNLSEYDMRSLVIDVIFKDGNTIIDEHIKKIADKDSPLKAFAFSPIISLKTREKQTLQDNFPKKITVEVYAMKTEDSYRMLLKTVDLEEKAKEKSGKRYFKFLFFTFSWPFWE